MPAALRLAYCAMERGKSRDALSAERHRKHCSFVMQYFTPPHLATAVVDVVVDVAAPPDHVAMVRAVAVDPALWCGVTVAMSLAMSEVATTTAG